MANVKPAAKKFSPLDAGGTEILVGASIPPGKFPVGSQFFHNGNSILYVYAEDGWQATTGASGVVESFLGLSDTPDAYSGLSEQFVCVRADQAGIDFVNPSVATSRLVPMEGASSGAAGAKGLVPAPSAGQQGRFLRADASWQNVVTNEVEVTRGAGPPVGLPASTNDLYVDISAANVWYSTGSIWEKIQVPQVADVYATMPGTYPSNPSAPTPAEAASYAASIGLVGPTVLSYSGGGTATDPAFAWFIDTVGSAVCVRDLTAQKGDPGPTGPAGPAGVVWRGQWSSGTNYAINDAVYYQGSSWRALQANVNVAPFAGANWALIAQKGADGVASDGDKGDITVTSSGNIWTIDPNAVTYSKMQDVSAASRLLGRGSTGPGDPQEITLGTGLSIVGSTLTASYTVPDGDYGDIQINLGQWRVDEDANIAFNSANIGSAGGGGAQLHSSSLNLLELRSGISAQNFAVYNSHTSSVSFERIAVGWSGNTARIGTEKGYSGGASRPLAIQTDGIERIGVSTNGQITFNQSYTFPTSNGIAGQFLAATPGGDLAWATPTVGELSAFYHSIASTLPHGLTAGNVGHPVFGSQAYDDIDTESWPTGIFAEYVDANRFKYASVGQSVSVPTALFETGYSVLADGRFVFWDKSDLKYKKNKPADSDPRTGPMLMVNEQIGTNYACLVVAMGPNSW
jgi:hypothetical protein